MKCVYCAGDAGAYDEHEACVEASMKSVTTQEGSTMQAYMQYEHESGLIARWHGGEYINIGAIWAVAGQPGIDGDDFHAYDVINVWDYAEGKPRIPRTLDAFAARVDEFVANEES